MKILYSQFLLVYLRKNFNTMWRKIEGFPCDYEIDINGNARNANWKGTGKIVPLKPQNNGNGYFCYRLWDGKRYKTVYIQILVAKAYPEICGKWFEGCEVDHKDCNRQNNNAYNLRCCTRKENHNNPITRKRNAEAQHSKQVIQLSKNGEYINKYQSVMEAERRTGVRHDTISKCCRGIIYKYPGGYSWKFANV